MVDLDGNTVPLHQGDVLALSCLPYGSVDDGGGFSVGLMDCPDGVVVVSQTCDALRKPTVQVAPVVRLTGAGLAEARTGKSTAYLPLWIEGEELFGDMSYVSTIDRKVLEACDRKGSGLSGHDDRRLFRDLVSRRYGRFPFPDEVVTWCAPLRDKIGPKAKKAGSQGAVLRKISAIRIEDANNWGNEREFDLTLSFLAEPGALPALGSFEPVERSLSEEALRAQGVWPLPERANAIADLLARPDRGGCTPLGVNALWQSLIDTWVDMCNEAYGKTNSGAVVRGSGEIVPEDEYSFNRMRRSEQLDLDYLSRGVE